MSTSRGLVVIFPDGRIKQVDSAIIEQGTDATTSVEVDGIEYQLYRYNLFGVRGTTYGYLGAMTLPSVEQRRAAAALLFGHGAFGVERLERAGNNKAASA